MNPKEALQHIKKLAPEPATFSQNDLYHEAFATLTALVDDHETMLKRAEKHMKDCKEIIEEYTQVATADQSFWKRESAVHILNRHEIIVETINYILKGEPK